MSNISRNTVREEARLRLGEVGWNLVGGEVPSSRTRGGGTGRPNLSVRRSYFNESSPDVSSVDSDYEADEESSSEEDLDSDVEEEKELKPPPTRLILEYESLKKCMEKNCRCPRCDGPVHMDVKTLCLASNVMVSCIDKECGYVDVSDLPATAQVPVGPKADERERSTDFAINVLYVQGWIC
jgi:hypothetical protein